MVGLAARLHDIVNAEDTAAFAGPYQLDIERTEQVACRCLKQLLLVDSEDAVRQRCFTAEPNVVNIDIIKL